MPVRSIERLQKQINKVEEFSSCHKSKSNLCEEGRMNLSRVALSFKFFVMSTISIIGIVAACLTTGAFVPQAVKTIKTKSTSDLSLLTFSMFFTGTLIWFAYGLIRQDMPIVLANFVTAILSGIILYLKLMSKTKKID